MKEYQISYNLNWGIIRQEVRLLLALSGNLTIEQYLDNALLEHKTYDLGGVSGFYKDKLSITSPREVITNFPLYSGLDGSRLYYLVRADDGTSFEASTLVISTLYQHRLGLDYLESPIHFANLIEKATPNHVKVVAEDMLKTSLKIGQLVKCYPLIKTAINEILLSVDPLKHSNITQWMVFAAGRDLNSITSTYSASYKKVFEELGLS